MHGNRSLGQQFVIGTQNLDGECSVEGFGDVCREIDGEDGILFVQSEARPGFVCDDGRNSVGPLAIGKEWK
jgi:hypothetical protein